MLILIHFTKCRISASQLSALDLSVLFSYWARCRISASYWYSLLNKYSFCRVVFILSSAVFLRLSSVQWICIVFCWFLFILEGAEFLHLSSVHWILVYIKATEQDAEFLHPIGIHCLVSIVFADFDSFYQMQNFCISAQCSGFECFV